MFVIFSFLITQAAFAQEVRENYNGARSLSMGGASIAVVNDETALLVNPAALGKLRDSYGTIFDPEIEGSKTDNDMYKSKAFTEPFDLEQVKATTDATRDSYYHVKAQLFPSFVTKNFGIGIHGSRVLDAKMNTAGTQMTTFYQEDVAVHMGFNLRFFEGRFKIGIAGKVISRIEINQDLDATQTLDIKSLAAEGVGVGSDAGLILAAPVAWLPTLSVVARDIGSTPFTAGSGLRMSSSSRPATVNQDFDVALAVFPIHGNRARSALTFEFDKLKAAADATDKSRYYHAGYEFNYNDALFIRGGMNQKYWTAGVELASERTQLQLSSYGEDVGTDGNSIEDRRYVFKFAFRF
jgi:hypothetical protein